METTLKTVQISLPQVDVNFLKTLARKMGWQVGGKAKSKLSSYEKACEDVCEGRVSAYDSLEDFYKEMGI